MIPPRLRRLLICPACEGEFEDLEPGLLCRPCHKVYPVEDGVPILLGARARKYKPGPGGDGTPPQR